MHLYESYNPDKTIQVVSLTVSVSSYLKMRCRRVIMAEAMTVTMTIYCKEIDTIYGIAKEELSIV
jgi:hypothetical protein